jgi:hypothetical protein
VANKELTAYVKWKSAEVIENKGTGNAFGLKDVTPAVFVRVRNKGLK